MTGIARFVTDPALKGILKDTDGIGTEATRAGIIELLFRRDYLTRDKKSILATAKGKALIAALPQSASTPDMTAHWECKLSAIAQGEQAYEDLIGPLSLELKQLIDTAVPVDLPMQAANPTNKFKAAKRPRTKARNAPNKSTKGKKPVRSAKKVAPKQA